MTEQPSCNDNGLAKIILQSFCFTNISLFFPKCDLGLENMAEKHITI